MRKLLLFCASTSLLLTLSACSGGANPGTSTGIVSAQTTYSTSSLIGTYSVTWISLISTDATNLSSNIAGGGTIQLNGSGSVTGGTLNFYAGTFGVSPKLCTYSVTGTYSIQSTALGTATLNLSSSTSGCATTATWQLALAAADGGAAIQMVRTDDSIASGTAIKQ